MKQPNMRICSDNLFAIKFENQSQHTMRGGMLGAEIHGVMADLAGLIVVADIGVRGLIDMFGVETCGMRESRVCGNYGRRLGFSIASGTGGDALREKRREPGDGLERGAETKSFGGVAAKLAGEGGGHCREDGPMPVDIEEILSQS